MPAALRSKSHVSRRRNAIRLIYGAGLLSSYGEMKHMTSAEPWLKDFDPFCAQPKMSYKDGFQKGASPPPLLSRIVMISSPPTPQGVQERKKAYLGLYTIAAMVSNFEPTSRQTSRAIFEVSVTHSRINSFHTGICGLAT